MSYLKITICLAIKPTVMSQTDSSLHVLWRQTCAYSDKKSFELLFYKLNRCLINFCNTYIHNERAAEEIVSDVFLACWTNRERLIDIESPKKYMYMAVKNKSLNYLKKYSHFQVVSLDEAAGEVLVDAKDVNAEIEQKEFFHKVDRIIQKLPNQSLHVFRLIKEDGMKYKEVADILGISPRTVQTHLSRALKKIGDCLQADRLKERKSYKNKLFSIILIGSILSLLSF